LNPLSPSSRSSQPRKSPQSPQSPQSRRSRRQAAADILIMLAIVLLPTVMLGGCVTRTPQPAPTLYRLPIASPVDVGPISVPSGWVWQIVGTPRVPEYLDRDALLMPHGDAGLRPLPGHRWAEPLQEAVPRVLRQDLAALLGAERVWTGPVPPGISVTRQLRLELQALEATPDRRAVRLRARWTLVDPTGQTPPKADQADLNAASAGTDPDHLVSAHRLALWRLAERIAGVPASG
jgi:uncharacterized lipoprotein YmbA